jgi:hypothetical protein
LQSTTSQLQSIVRPDSWYFVENDVPQYNDATFQAHFRMNRATFQVVDLIYICITV